MILNTKKSQKWQMVRKINCKKTKSPHNLRRFFIYNSRFTFRVSSLFSHFSLYSHAQNPIHPHSQKTTYTWCVWACLLMPWDDKRIPKTRTIRHVPTRTRTESCILDCEFCMRDIYSNNKKDSQRSWKSDNMWRWGWYDIFWDASTWTLHAPG